MDGSYPWENYTAEPEEGQIYWYIRNDGIIANHKWLDMPDDHRRWDFGNVFFTRADAWLAQSRVRMLFGATERRLGKVDALDDLTPNGSNESQ